MINEAWLKDVMEIQGEILLDALLLAGEYTQLPVISSTRSQYPFEGYYTIVPKLKEIPLEERIKLGQENDPDDNWSVLMDAIYEGRTMGEMDDDQESELKEEWLESRGIPKYTFNTTIFTDRESCNDLPFDGFTFRKLVSIIFEHYNFQAGNITIIGGEGKKEIFPIIKKSIVKSSMINEMALYSLKEKWSSPLSVFASSPKEAMEALLTEYEITSFQISFLKHFIPEARVLHVDCTTSIDLMTCDTDDEWLLSLREKGLENYLNEVFESKYPDL